MNLELAAAELRWYFRLAPGEVGLSSNFGPMVRRLQGIHAAPNGVPVDGQRMAAAGRMSRIEVRLKRLASSDQYVVRLAFSGETHRDLVRVLLTMPSAQAAFVQSKSKRSLFAWVCRLLKNGRRSSDRERRRLYARLVDEAERRIDSSLTAYEEAG